MKSLHKFTSLALLMLFVSMFFVEDAFACSGAYYGWKWANNKNATGLTAKMCSRDFYYNLDASKYFYLEQYFVKSKNQPVHFLRRFG